MKMSGPTPESLAIDCELKCAMCKESVNYGDDYITHLQLAHSVTQNIPFFLDKALKVKNEKRKKPAEDIVTLEEDVSYPEAPMEKSDYQENDADDEPIELDDATKKRIEKTVEATMDELFKDLKLMIEGKLPIDSNEDANSLGEEEMDPYAADQKIWQSFEDLKNKISTLEFPPEILQQFYKPQSAEEESPTVFGQTGKSSSGKGEGDMNNSSKRNWSKASSVKRKEKGPGAVKATNLNLSDRDVSTSKTQENRPPSVRQEDSLSGKQENSARPENSQKPTGTKQTFFICPIENCQFSTTKQGMLDGDAANHLSKTHKITGAAMKAAKPGAYKFKKVKGEPTFYRD